jgi:hypothetical protein
VEECSSGSVRPWVQTPVPRKTRRQCRIWMRTSPKSWGDMAIQVQEALTTSNTYDQNIISVHHHILKLLSMGMEKEYWKLQERSNRLHKVKPIWIIADFSAETLKARMIYFKPWEKISVRLDYNN